MATVYIITRDPSKNMLPAAAFGNLECILKDNEQVGPGAYSFEEMREKLTDGLLEFDAEEDFLLPNGDPVAMGLAFDILYRKFCQFSVLKWDRQERAYYVVTCTAPFDEDEEE